MGLVGVWVCRGAPVGAVEQVCRRVSGLPLLVSGPLSIVSIVSMVLSSPGSVLMLAL